MQLESHFSLREVDVSLERRKLNKKQKGIRSMNAIVFIVRVEMKEKIFASIVKYRSILFSINSFSNFNSFL